MMLEVIVGASTFIICLKLKNAAKLTFCKLTSATSFARWKFDQTKWLFY